MKFIAFLAIVAVAFAATDDTFKQFHQWTMDHEKIYSNLEEYTARFEIFKDNLAIINHLNRQGKGVFAPNKFTDLSREEFAAKYLMTPFIVSEHPVTYKPRADVVNADEKNWCTEGYCNHIKDQKSCGSCWAFSAVANMEGVYKVAKKELPDIAEQQLVDCEHDCMIFPGTTQKVCDAGCNGGLMPNAFTYAIREGMEAQADYPYTARTETCKFDATKVKYHFNAWKWVDKDEKAMVAALNELGPLSVAVDASYWSSYHSGIYDSTCSSTRLNHGVALVGYGTEGATQYWIIRNSWGTGWGMSGYMHLIRGKNKCGVDTFVCSITI